MLIDSTFFNGELLIPNAEKPTVSAAIEWFVNQYEAEFLTEIMGADLYEAFKLEAFGEDGQLLDPIPDPWLKFVNGDSLNGWKGLIYQPGTNPDYKKSPIANYVYFWFMTNYNTQSTGVGEVKPLTENATAANPSPKMVKAWNDMVKDVHSMWNYFGAQNVVYPLWESSYRYFISRKLSRINEFNI